MQKQNLAVVSAVLALVYANSAKADDSELLKRIEQLETRISELENNQTQTPIPTVQGTPINSMSAFNPYISVVLNGAYNYYSNKDKEISGFQIGEEGESPDKGFSLGESEINIGANVDDKFLANLTAAVVSEDGDDKVELEEAFIQTIGLPYGITATAGRMKPVFGYLNEKHAHTDEFADRPLPYRVFLNNSYRDDGAQVSIVLPTDFYTEIGGGLYKGGYFPASSEGSGDGAANAFVKFGGDITDNQAWLAGVSYLYAKSNKGRESDDITFKGKDNLYGLSLKYTYAPTGNNKESELALQGEYLFRDEKGKYNVENAGFEPYDNKSSGWYLQGTYKFMSNWKVGYRYAQMRPDDVPDVFKDTPLDSQGHKPEIHSLMAEWNNSEFSRIRLQYNYDKTSKKDDNQIVLEYTMSFGAHGAHSF